MMETDEAMHTLATAFQRSAFTAAEAMQGIVKAMEATVGAFKRLENFLPIPDHIRQSVYLCLELESQNLHPRTAEWIAYHCPKWLLRTIVPILEHDALSATRDESEA